MGLFLFGNFRAKMARNTKVQKIGDAKLNECEQAIGFALIELESNSDLKAQLREFLEIQSLGKPVINLIPSNSRAGSKGLSADGGWVEVVIHQAVDDAGQLRLNQEVTGCLKSRDELTKSSTQLFHKINNLLFCLVVREPVVEIGDNVNADLACELVSRPRGTTKGQGKGAGKDEELHCAAEDV